MTPDKEVTVGVVFRGMQSEYGPEHCLWKKTRDITSEAAEALTSKYGGRVIEIENHLYRSGLTPQEIETQYSNCDLIVSSRFHSAMLALRHGVPSIAIDQIQGGAKLLDYSEESVGRMFFKRIAPVQRRYFKAPIPFYPTTITNCYFRSANRRFNVQTSH
jgi:hypothetical protein